MSTIFESKPNQTFIFIDGSYFCFYRYFSLMNWWRNAYPEEPMEDPFKNEKFVEKFRKTFVENVQQIPKKLGLNKLELEPIIIVGKDCKRENIWRTELFPKYKANRANGAEDGFMGGPFFKMAYEEELFVKGGAKAILKHNKLEADDCIAISVMRLTAKYPDCSIYIITSDKDYLQLNSHNVHLFNLAFKNIAENKSSTGVGSFTWIYTIFYFLLFDLSLFCTILSIWYRNILLFLNSLVIVWCSRINEL